MALTESFNDNVAIATYVEDVDECEKYIQELCPNLTLMDCRNLMHMIKRYNKNLFEEEEVKGIFNHRIIVHSVKVADVDSSIENYVDRVGAARSMARKKVSEEKRRIKVARLIIIHRGLSSLSNDILHAMKIEFAADMY